MLDFHKFPSTGMIAIAVLLVAVVTIIIVGRLIEERSRLSALRNRNDALSQQSANLSADLAVNTESFRREIERTFSEMDRNAGGILAPDYNRMFEGIMARVEQSSRQIHSTNANGSTIVTRNGNSNNYSVMIDNSILIIDAPDALPVRLVDVLRRQINKYPHKDILCMTMKQVMDVVDGKIKFSSLVNCQEVPIPAVEPKPFKKTKRRRNFDTLTKDQA